MAIFKIFFKVSLVVVIYALYGRRARHMVWEWEWQWQLIPVTNTEGYQFDKPKVQQG